MNIISTDLEKYYFLNMCILCRYARFSQAQSHFNYVVCYNHILISSHLSASAYYNQYLASIVT